jgi:mono/diheme cytochrome c family protein
VAEASSLKEPASAEFSIEEMTLVHSQYLSSNPAQRRRLVFQAALFSISAALALTFFCFEPTLARAQKSQPHPTEKSGTGDVARGKYIVESVAVCGQCHTPRDGEGNPDRARWLQGSALPYLPAKPDTDWPLSAPRIGGNPPASDADMVKLLTTGIWTTGNRLRFPMPLFRMDPKDAEAVVAYLKSVPAKQ